MNPTWTERDEKKFQALLKRRRAATAKAAGGLSQEAIDGFAEGMADDYGALDAWEQFLAWAHPDEVADIREYPV